MEGVLSVIVLLAVFIAFVSFPWVIIMFSKPKPSHSNAKKLLQAIEASKFSIQSKNDVDTAFSFLGKSVPKEFNFKTFDKDRNINSYEKKFDNKWITLWQNIDTKEVDTVHVFYVNLSFNQTDRVVREIAKQLLDKGLEYFQPLNMFIDNNYKASITAGGETASLFISIGH